MTPNLKLIILTLPILAASQEVQTLETLKDSPSTSTSPTYWARAYKFTKTALLKSVKAPIVAQAFTTTQ
jgi:hypothetical protein